MNESLRKRIAALENKAEMAKEYISAEVETIDGKDTYRVDATFAKKRCPELTDRPVLHDEHGDPDGYFELTEEEYDRIDMTNADGLLIRWMKSKPHD